MIAILDYGAGNLRSVENTLSAIGAEYVLVRDASGLRAATKILLPGVGHFGQMMRALDQLQVRGVLLERIGAGVPFLGICLGLQALFESSEEAPEARGLALFEGAVRRFPAAARVPHMLAGISSYRAPIPACWPVSIRESMSISRIATMRPKSPPPPPLALTRCPTPPCSNRVTPSACSFIPRSPERPVCASSAISWS